MAEKNKRWKTTKNTLHLKRKKKEKKKKTENDINHDWKNRKSQFLLFWVHCLRILQHFVGLSKLHTPSFLRTVINIWSDLLTFYQNYYYTSALISIHLVLNIGWTIIYFIKIFKIKQKSSKINDRLAWLNNCWLVAKNSQENFIHFALKPLYQWIDCP